MYFLGVDAGATKTTVACVDAGGRLIGYGEGGPGHHLHVGVAGLVRSLQEAISRAGLGGRRFSAAYLGLAGLGLGEQAPELERTIRESIGARAARLFNDGYIALIGAFLGKPGIAAVAGTGSVVLALDRKGEVWRVGGWGHLLGDEGGAYRIALDAIRRAVRSHDGLEGPTVLLELMMTFFNLDNPREVIRLLYGTPRGNKDAIAGFAPLVVQAARQGDRAAREVLEANLSSLARASCVLAHRVDVPPVVAPVGGVFRSGYVRELFCQFLAEEGLSVVEPALPPVLGAAWLGLREEGRLTPVAMRRLLAAAQLRR